MTTDANINGRLPSKEHKEVSIKFWRKIYSSFTAFLCESAVRTHIDRSQDRKNPTIFFFFFFFFFWTFPFLEQMKSRRKKKKIVESQNSSNDSSSNKRSVKLNIFLFILGASIGYILSSNSFPVREEALSQPHGHYLPEQICRSHDSENHRRGWRWTDPSLKCNPDDIVVTPSDSELSYGMLTYRTVQQATRVFQACGLVAIGSAVPKTDVDAFRDALYAKLKPFLESRERIRSLMMHSMANNIFIGDLTDQVMDEYVLRAGNVFRERNDGRIDVQLDLKPPFNSSSFINNPLLLDLIRSILGSDAKLKSSHSVVALTEEEGITDQHWHRDNGILFPDDSHFIDKSVHSKANGVHLPPYGINMFVPLVDYTSENGATEFTLGSHMW